MQRISRTRARGTVDPVMALGRMVLRTEAIAHSRRSGYYRPRTHNNNNSMGNATRTPPSATPPTSTTTLHHASLEAFAFQQRTGQGDRQPSCITCVKDALGNEFVLIPLVSTSDTVGLVRLRRVPCSVPAPLAAVVARQVSLRAMVSADLIDQSLGRRIAWHVVPAGAHGSSSNSTDTEQELTSEDVGSYLRQYLSFVLPASSSSSSPSALPSSKGFHTCAMESRTVRAA